jgi:PAH dioxygenase large subunit
MDAIQTDRTHAEGKLMTATEAQTTTSSALEQIKAEWSDGTIPPRIYADDSIHQEERERIFGSMWQFLAHTSEIPNPGDFVVRYILDDSIIVARGKDGTVRAMHNVCRHRGMPVCRADLGNVERFTCPYHGWLYDSDGRLVSLPMDRPFFGESGIDREAMSLNEIARCDEHDGFIFGSLAPTGPSLIDYLGDFRWYLDIHTKRDPAGLEVIGEPQRWRVRANWKTGAENFAGDSYHAQHTHKSVFAIGLHPNAPTDFKASGSRNGVHIDAGPGTMSLARQSALDRGYPADMVDTFRDTYPADLERALFRGDTPFWPTRTHIFPNTSFLNAGCYIAEDNMVPFLTFRVWRPLAVDLTEVWSWVLVEKGATEQFKRDTRRAFTLTFGTSGTEEQDDVECFQTIQRVNKGNIAAASKQHLTMGDSLDPSMTDIEWNGPGQAVGTTLTDAGNKRFLRLWADAMQITDRDNNPSSDRD